MSIDNLVFSQPGFYSPRWEKALKNLEIVTNNTTHKDISPNCLIWVLTERDDWENVCKKYNESKHRVMVLSHHPNTAELKTALQMGAKGYLNSLSNSDVLTKAATSVQNGAIWLPGSLVNELLSLLAQQKKPSEKQDFSKILTPRQLDIAKLVAQGMNNKAIAQALDIKDRTVKSHLTNVFEKLAVKNRLQLSLKIKDSI